MQQHPAFSFRITRRTVPDTIRKAKRRRAVVPLREFPLGNVVVGIILVSGRPVVVVLDPDFIALIAGALAIGTYLSLHFGKVRRQKDLN